MKTTTISIALLLSSLGALTSVLVPFASPPSPAAPPTASVSVPSADSIWQHSVDDLRMGDGYWATVEISNRSEVKLKWYYNPGADQVKKNVVAKGAQTFQFQGVVTSAAPGPAGELIVSSLLRNGATRIEKVLLDSPVLVVTADGPTLVPQAFLSRSVLYQANSPGMQVVRFITKFRGVDGGYMLQFDDSRDFYLLHSNAQPATVTLLLPAQVDDLLLVDFNSCNAGEHSTSGYVYYFGQSEPNSSHLEYAFRMIDSDKDGTFDFIGSLSQSAVATLNLLPLSEWIEVRGFPVEELLHASQE